MNPNDNRQNVRNAPASAPQQNQAQNNQAQGGPQNPNEERIAVNGFAQVLDMLKVADPAFRESLLRRIAAKDRNLARTLREDLSLLGL